MSKCKLCETCPRCECNECYERIHNWVEDKNTTGVAVPRICKDCGERE